MFDTIFGDQITEHALYGEALSGALLDKLAELETAVSLEHVRGKKQWLAECVNQWGGAPLLSGWGETRLAAVLELVGRL